MGVSMRDGGFEAGAGAAGRCFGFGGWMGVSTRCSGEGREIGGASLISTSISWLCLPARDLFFLPRSDSNGEASRASFLGTTLVDDFV